MKTLRNTAILLLLSVGFVKAQNITVQGEKKLNTDFTKYKTFGWMLPDKPGNNIVVYSYEEFPEPTVVAAAPSEKVVKKAKSPRNSKNKDVVVYSYYYTIPSEDQGVNNALINSVEDEMEGRGYKKDEVNPDILVAYKIFDQTTKIKGYDAEPVKVDANTEVHQPQDTVSYKLKPGTVLISLVDAKSGSVVWEGYASGVAKNNDAINDQAKVKEAINLIFKKYEFRGDKYSVN